jgi:hypothetical protein
VIQDLIDEAIGHGLKARKRVSLKSTYNIQVAYFSTQNSKTSDAAFPNDTFSSSGNYHSFGFIADNCLKFSAIGQ